MSHANQRRIHRSRSPATYGAVVCLNALELSHFVNLGNSVIVRKTKIKYFVTKLCSTILM